jgi:hypothetical protein
VLDATLTIQYEHLPEICSHMGETDQNLKTIGEKLEQCLNSLPLGTTTIIEEPQRLAGQVTDIASKFQQANGLLESDSGQNEQIVHKMNELRTLVELEKSSLAELRETVEEDRALTMEKVSEAASDRVVR